jgi:NAD(P)-dependent dehydrogenase (short-subunit alcohol dehydrogenase family)
VALVTGFSKGLGWAMAQSLADAHVAICGIVSRDLLHLTGHDWSSVIKADLTTSFHLAKETSPLMGRASALPMSRMPYTRLAKLLYPLPGCPA